MVTSTDRQSFRELVAEVAARAKERLPEAVNGRVESGARLVLLHDVTPQADGSILVGSSTDPLKQYRLVGTACECQDFTRGQAPGGWCQHRIAAGIHKRVRELRPAPVPPVPEDREPWPFPEDDPEPEPVLQTPTRPAVPLPEAPASVNVRVQIGGREVQWTLRDTDEARLALRLDALLARYPVPPPPAPPAQLTPQQHNAVAQHQKVTGVCAVHSVPMTLNQKEGRSWYSHRLPEGGWCKGK